MAGPRHRVPQLALKVKTLALIILGAAMALSPEWRVILGAFLGSVAAHLFMLERLRRTVSKTMTAPNDDGAATPR